MYPYSQHPQGSANGGNIYNNPGQQPPQQQHPHQQQQQPPPQQQHPAHPSHHQQPPQHQPPPAPYQFVGNANGMQAMRADGQSQSMPPTPQYPPQLTYGQQPTQGTSLPSAQHLLYGNGGSSGVQNGGLAVMAHPFISGPPQQQLPPQTTAQRCAPSSFSKGEWSFSISVEQQPVRARMCGFGDKDRRPITPPPCVKLVVKNKDTGEEIDINEIDSSFYVLTVDLWSIEGAQEVNLVRHSSSTPAMSISASSTTSYPPQPERPMMFFSPYGSGMAPPMYANPPGAVQPIAPPGIAATPIGMSDPQQQHAQPPHPSQQAYLSNPQTGYAIATPGYIPPGLIVPNSQSGMFTRNLIGSLAVNAFRLEDQDRKLGLWFVLQDLSVRTEGTFRLKMSFIDVGDSNTTSGLNLGNAPVLATCYSNPFTVYSAKKFPGVIESTDLSKAFARQGIKIPIRKDSKPVANQDEYDNDNQDPSSGNV